MPSSSLSPKPELLWSPKRVDLASLDARTRRLDDLDMALGRELSCWKVGAPGFARDQLDYRRWIGEVIDAICEAKRVLTRIKLRAEGDDVAGLGLEGDRGK